MKRFRFIGFRASLASAPSPVYPSFSRALHHPTMMACESAYSHAESSPGAPEFFTIRTSNASPSFGWPRLTASSSALFMLLMVR